MFKTGMTFVWIAVSSVFALQLESVNVNERGYWEGPEAAQYHFFDRDLAPALLNFFEIEGATSIGDFGCGMGDYLKIFAENAIPCEGFDGNPATVELTEGLGSVHDLSRPLKLHKKFDWILSLEVGEHIPKKYERIFIENLVRHCCSGIVLSWAVKNQGGHGHFNEQDNDYIRAMVSRYGFESDFEVENTLRQHAGARWFKNTIMVFRKRNPV